MLDEALANHIAQLGDQALIHEHAIEFAFLGIYKQSSHGLVQVVEYLLEVGRCLSKRILCTDQIKDLEEAVDVAV